MIEVIGKEGIVARVIADSISNGNRIITVECEYPRFIHSEIMTHRMFSRNAMSSRAIPVAKMLQQVRDNPAMPVFWAKNQAGMQAVEEVDNVKQISYLWQAAALCAAQPAETLSEQGLHKAIANRLVEPFQRMKTIITSTEWDNFFWLRDHPAAQQEFQELAKLLREAIGQSIPEELYSGEWHTPYVTHQREEHGLLRYIDADGSLLTPEVAKKISASCAAQVSYRKNDTSVDKAEDLFLKLGVGTQNFHGSPFEHIATPIKIDGSANYRFAPSTWEEGVSHMDRLGNLWSGNFKGWIQYRKVLEC